jgi:N-acetylglucosamine-6-phosphate deacetylase
MIKGFKNANVYVEGLGIVKKTVLVENGKISKICDDCECEGLITLSEDKIVVPGFIDKHVHGGNNSDGMYSSLEDAKNISKTIAKEGVTSYLITTMTQSKENITAALVNAKEYINTYNYEGAKPIGIHLEGPFINKKFKGAQIESCIVPCDVETFKEYNEASGNNILQVTLAYEENGKELVNYLRDNKIVASLGHTDATCDQALEAVAEGATSFTHTYNAMKPLHHREAGVVGAAFLADEAYCEMICDLIHLNKNAIKVLYKAKGKDKLIAITDGIEAKHLPDGQYQLGGQPVYVKNNEARLIDGTLAGSTLLMNNGLKNIKNVLELSIEDTVNMATKNPAINLYIYDKKGSIKEGKDADFAIIDSDFNVYMTVVEGNIVFEK